MRSKSMLKPLRVAAFGPIRKQLFCRATIEAGGKRALIAHCIQAGEGFDKNVPSQVLRSGYISRDAHTQGIDSAGMGVKERAKRLQVTFLRAS